MNMSEVPTRQVEVCNMYMDKGRKADDAALLAAGYMDAIDAIIDTAHGLLKLFGPVDVTLNSTSGNKVKVSAEAL